MGSGLSRLGNSHPTCQFAVPPWFAVNGPYQLTNDTPETSWLVQAIPSKSSPKLSGALDLREGVLFRGCGCFSASEGGR